MSEPLKQIADANARLLAVQQERADCEKSALAHEHQARQDRLRMTELKKEEAELHTVLSHAKVRNAADVAMEQAQKARAEAERAKAESVETAKAQAALMQEATEKANALIASLEEKQKNLDDLIAAAKSKPEDKQNSG